MKTRKSSHRRNRNHVLGVMLAALLIAPLPVAAQTFFDGSLQEIGLASLHSGLSEANAGLSGVRVPTVPRFETPRIEHPDDGAEADGARFTEGRAGAARAGDPAPRR